MAARQPHKLKAVGSSPTSRNQNTILLGSKSTMPKGDKIATSSFCDLNDEDIMVFVDGCPAWRIGSAGVVL